MYLINAPCPFYRVPLSFLAYRLISYTMDWAEKYRPERLQDIVGNGSAVRQLAEWARNWSPDAKPLLIYGKPGIGKTSAAHALAADMEWEVVELNASDQRTRGVIEKVAGSSATTASLTGALRKLIILDEADNLHGTADRGGARAILDLIRRTRQPIILIANDLYGVADELRRACEPVQFRALPARTIVPRLKYICAAESLCCSEDALGIIAETAGGDIRAAVNMLYAAAVGKKELGKEDISTSRKDERSTIFELVAALYRCADDQELMRMAREVPDTPDTIIQWIAGNVDRIPDPEARARAFCALSRADEFLGRTLRRQYYLLWRYASALMVIGAASAAGGGSCGRIQPPSHWKKMSSSRKQGIVRRSVMQKLSEHMHIPHQPLRKDFLVPITLLVEHDPVGAVEELDLERDELSFFLHDRELVSSVMKEVAEREKTREAERALAPVIREEAATRKGSEEEREAEKEAGKKVPPTSQSSLFDRF
jgi:replication factor C large subunit